jgi:hypothetical protein
MYKAKKASKQAVFKPLGLPAFSDHLKISSRIVQGGRQLKDLRRKPGVLFFIAEPSVVCARIENTKGSE